MRIRAGIEHHIDSRIPDDLPQAIQAIVLKNISEALNNIEKHAHATRVMVATEAVDGGIRVEVDDDGTGFVVAESVRVSSHIGLVGMRESTQSAGCLSRSTSEHDDGTQSG